MSGKGDKPRKVGPEFYKNFDDIFRKRRRAPRRKRPPVVESEPTHPDGCPMCGALDCERAYGRPGLCQEDR